MIPGGTPSPPNATLTGLVTLVALWVRVSVPEKDPVVVGENLITTPFDCPGPKLNAPPPAVKKNGLDGKPTFPVSTVDEVGLFEIVRT